MEIPSALKLLGDIMLIAVGTYLVIKGIQELMKFRRIRRAVVLLFFLFASVTSFAQADNFQGLLDSGKAEYKREVVKDQPNFKTAYEYLEKAVQLNPKSAEARYFFGYTIDKLNGSDAESIVLLNKDLTLRASAQFEFIIKLEPQYKGEFLVLDPYSKIGAIWGSLAFKYLNIGKIDSAKWAFKEGKKRGGFLESMLEFHRQLLNNCNGNSILFTVGDNVTFSIYYLQLLEKFRTDIIPVDASLLHGTWYPKFLKRYTGLSISYSDNEIDTLDYQLWEPTQIKIENPKDKTVSLYWILKPTYNEHYILKGNKIMLDILQHNYFKREVYFTAPSDTTFNLFLEPYLLNENLVERLIATPEKRNELFKLSDNITRYSFPIALSQEMVISRDVCGMWNYLRWAYINRIVFFKDWEKDFVEAKKLFLKMEKIIPVEKLSFPSDIFKENYNSIKESLFK
jgi:hypothetical protein